MESGHGHHRHGSGLGKEEFPEGWEEAEVIEWVEALIDNPSGYYEAFPDGVYIYGLHHGVLGRIVVRRWGSWVIATAHPQDTVRWFHD